MGNRSLWSSKFSMILSGHIVMIWLYGMVLIRWHLGVLRRNVPHSLTKKNVIHTKMIPNRKPVGKSYVSDTNWYIHLDNLKTSYSMITRTHWLIWQMRWWWLVRITPHTGSKDPRNIPILWVILGITFLLVYLFNQGKVHLEICMMCGGWDAANMIRIIILLQCASMQRKQRRSIYHTVKLTMSLTPLTVHRLVVRGSANQL